MTDKTIYKAPLYESGPCFETAPCAQLDSFHWEAELPYRPKTSAQLCAVRGGGIYYRAFTDETDLRAVGTQRDDPVYEDSCLELFLNPFPEQSDCYINVEVNPNGAFLCQFGPERENRRWVRDLTELAPEVHAFRENGGWGITVHLGEDFLQALYGADYHTQKRTMRGNFYKCGDRTDHPHYGAFAPVSTLPPGFHNPECFADIILL
ncbi:MAG: carbohydrate-binding family 9-like protein [Clostridia bacterium]